MESNYRIPRRLSTLWFGIALLLVLCHEAHAETLSGRAAVVAAGDSFTLTAHRKRYPIRLADADTPESGQPYADEARQILTELIFAKALTVEVLATDGDGRLIARVYADDLEINRRMVELGAAWVARQGYRDKTLFEVELAAQRRRQGLWALPESERTPPWLWRQQREFDIQRGRQCGGKRFCSQMITCVEARQYLNQCGLTGLDSDGDGVPCEGVCQ